MAQYSVLCDDGSEVAIFEKTPEEALQTAIEHGYRAVKAWLCDEPELEERELQNWQNQEDQDGR